MFLGLIEGAAGQIISTWLLAVGIELDFVSIIIALDTSCACFLVAYCSAEFVRASRSFFLDVETGTSVNITANH